MPKGISIHIGVDYVDENHYGSRFKLPFCVRDAKAMQDIAAQNGFNYYILENEDAISHNLFNMLGQAASELEKNDILFISFSGHGCQFKDLNGDEEDGYDEGILLYDKIIIDDQLNIHWAKFKPGVRVLFISDSCYSGTITKEPQNLILQNLFKRKNILKNTQMDNVYQNNKFMYDAELKNIIPQLKTNVECSVLLLSACQEDELAGAGTNSKMQLSSFTEVLVECWSNDRFEGTYKNFYTLLCDEMKKRKMSQRPNYYTTGKKHPYFEQQIPFSI